MARHRITFIGSKEMVRSIYRFLILTTMEGMYCKYIYFYVTFPNSSCGCFVSCYRAWYIFFTSNWLVSKGAFPSPSVRYNVVCLKKKIVLWCNPRKAEQVNPLVWLQWKQHPTQLTGSAPKHRDYRLPVWVFVEMDIGHWHVHMNVSV